MKQTDRLLAEKLLQISAINLQPSNPFTWASGWNSPIYTDNRKTLSYPDIRSFIKVEICRIILENFPDTQYIAGVATGAIAIGALVADTLIEDLISTGGSSLKAVEAIRNAGCEVVGMCALFSYEFPLSVKRFRDANVQLITLSNYSAMLDVALETNYIRPEDVLTLKEWRKDPANWTPGNINIEA